MRNFSIRDSALFPSPLDKQHFKIFYFGVWNREANMMLFNKISNRSLIACHNDWKPCTYVIKQFVGKRYLVYDARLFIFSAKKLDAVIILRYFPEQLLMLHKPFIVKIPVSFFHLSQFFNYAFWLFRVYMQMNLLAGYFWIKCPE